MKKLILVLLMLALMLTLTACKCKHEVTLVTNAKDATCTEEGYTGDTVCSKCQEVVAAGAAIPAAGHTEGELQGVLDATCTEEGYTGDAFCTVCEAQLVQGEAVVALGHTPTERIGVMEPTCTAEGYTGDVFCALCEERLETGEAIEMLPHTPGELENVVEPTCTEEGYSGDVYCTVCGTCTTQGEAVAALGHTLGEPANVVESTCLADGYTGDFPCTVCGEILPGEVVERLPHTFENDTCTVCGWRTPGMYIAAALEFPWDELVETGYVKLDGAALVSVSEGLHGDLVVGEEVTEVKLNAFRNCQLTKVTLPVDCTVIGSKAFDVCKKLEEVVFFGAIEEIKDGTFYGCEALVSFVVPESVTRIGGQAFEKCAALEKVVLPDGVTQIGQNAFKNCTALVEINVPASLQELGSRAFENCLSMTAFDLPEGLTELGMNAFSGSGVTHMTIPSTIEKLSSQGNTMSLVYADLSRLSVQKFQNGGMFAGCEELETVILPAGLIELGTDTFRNCYSLKEIVLPDTLMTITGSASELSRNANTVRVVWPVALSDGSALAELPFLEEICYKGSEAQWNMTVSKDLFPSVKVIFDYTEE